MKNFALYCLLACLALHGPPARAQALVGDGLRGEYYQGLDFDRLEGTRRDAQLDFEWQGQPPLRGMLADYFTVRWMGWLVPPVTGRYLLRLTVDDGVRLWLDNKQLLSEWRGQPLGYYEVSVDLQAGHAYRLRLDYAQYSATSRLQLAWERPRRPEALGSWRNLWQVRQQASNRQREVIPTRYLFSKLPSPRQAAPPPAPPRPMETVVLTSVQVRPPHTLAVIARPAPAVRPPAAQRRPVPPRLVAVAPRLSVPPTPLHLVAPVRLHPADTLAAQLVRGKAVTLRALYFEQGQANLLVPVRTSLDTLARVLTRNPSLRLEVQGHTDNQGDPALNQQLSLRRAEAVCHYLNLRGIAASRLQPIGLGGTQPVADNNLPAERPHNRRVVLRPLP